MTLRTGAILSMGLAVVAVLFPGTNGEATKASQQASSAELIVNYGLGWQSTWMTPT